MFKNTTSDRSRQRVASAGGGAPSGCPHSRLPAGDEDSRDCGRNPRSLSTAHIRPFYQIATGASLLKASRGVGCPAVGGGKRKQISGFSRSSRLRLMRTIARVRRDASLPCFVTLTYPDRFPTVEQAKRDLKVFLQRFKRAFPEAGGIWKLEPQQRGAPHYHMLVWGVDEVELFIWVLRAWHEIAGQGDENHYLFHAGMLKGSKPCVSQVRSFRGVWSYASKYLGKVFEVVEWGSRWTGRYWGTFSPKNVPFGELLQVDLTLPQVHDLMRYQRRFSKQRCHRASRYQNSMTIFCDADQWAMRMAELLSG